MGSSLGTIWIGSTSMGVVPALGTPLPADAVQVSKLLSMLPWSILLPFWIRVATLIGFDTFLD